MTQKLQRTFSNSSFDSVDSTYSLNSVHSNTSLGSTNSLDSLLTPSTLPNLFIIPSASRNVQFKNEVKSIRSEIENACRKSSRKQKKKKKGLDKLIVYYSEWETWLRKHRKGSTSRTVGGLSEGEFKILFNWFSSRMKSNPDGVRGINVALVVDEFMLSGLYADRAEAYSFVCKIDKKRNGQVTLEDFIAAFQDKDVSQLYFLKKFVKEVTPADNEKHQTRAFTSHSVCRNLHTSHSQHRGRARRGGGGASGSSMSPSPLAKTLLPVNHQPLLSNSPGQRNTMSPLGFRDESDDCAQEDGGDELRFPLIPSPIAVRKKSLKCEA